MTTSHPSLPRGFAVFPRRLLVEQGAFAAMVWAGFSAFMLVLPVVVSFFRPIEVSGWSFSQSIVQWYTLAIGCYVGWQMFELHVTHGQSRRGFLKSAFIFVVIYSAIVAALCALTYLPEALIYNIAGWPQTVDDERLYQSALQLPIIFLQGWLVFGLYCAGGLFLGMAWYRSSLLGGLAIPFAVAVSWVAAVGMASDNGPLQFLVQEGVVPDTPQLWLAVLLHAVCVAIFFVVTWYFGRNAPIRHKAA
jgi:hypothetical protein